MKGRRREIKVDVITKTTMSRKLRPGCSVCVQAKNCSPPQRPTSKGPSRRFPDTSVKMVAQTLARTRLCHYWRVSHSTQEKGLYEDTSKYVLIKLSFDSQHAELPDSHLNVSKKQQFLFSAALIHFSNIHSCKCLQHFCV